MTDEEFNNLSEKEITDLMNGTDRKNHPGTVSLELDTPFEKEEQSESEEKPENYEDYSVEDWTRLMKGKSSGKADIFKD